MALPLNHAQEYVRLCVRQLATTPRTPTDDRPCRDLATAKAEVLANRARYGAPRSFPRIAA